MKKVFIQLILLLFGGFLHGQQASTNVGNLRVHTGASLSVFGNFTNASSGVLVNNGSVYVKGSINNDQSSMGSGTGILYLNGSTAQSINGSQTFYTFNLVSNNNTGITLNNNLSVSSNHTFTSGIITTSSTPNYLVYEAGSSYNGDGDTKHVNGWVKKLGSANFIFPVGNGTVERTVALSSLSASSEFNAKYFANTPFYTQMQSPIWDVNEPEYWSVNKVSGGTASVTLNWDYTKVYFSNWIVPDILVTGYNGSLWVNNGGTASGNATSTGTITSGSISAFNLFTFGSRSYPLPVTLISFTASRQSNYTQVAWTTENEYNADHFVVERSDDGRSFYDITQLPARNSGITEQYYIKDNAPIHTVAYYRLRFIDIDGKIKLSHIVSVKVLNTKTLLTLLVNPVHDQLILAASSQLNGSFNYRINATNGQVVQQGKLIIQNGGRYILPLKGNPGSGIYILEVNIYQQSFFYKFTIQ